MALFNYQASDSSGRILKGIMEARDENDLVSKLQGMGHFPISVERPDQEKAAAALPVSLTRFPRRIPNRNVVNFTHELSSLLDAGFPLDGSLSILAQLEDNKAFREVILDIYVGIQAGSTLADCLEKHADVFSETYISAVRAGEAGGALEKILARIKNHMEETERIRDDVKSALIYPLLLTVFGGGAVLLIILFVVPKFSVIFADMGGVMPLPTRILLAVSDGFVRFWWLLGATVVAASFSFRRYLGTAHGRFSIDRIKIGLPLIGPVLRKIAVSRFSRTLGILLQGGVPILEALKIASKTIGNLSISNSMQPVVEGVRSGKGVSVSLKEAGSFPPLAVHMLTVGEETGKLDEMLLKLADNYDRDVSTALKRLLSLIEPVLILVMALIIGFIVISLLLAIFSINEMPM